MTNNYILHFTAVKHALHKCREIILCYYAVAR